MSTMVNKGLIDYFNVRNLNNEFCNLKMINNYILWANITLNNEEYQLNHFIIMSLANINTNILL